MFPDMGFFDRGLRGRAWRPLPQRPASRAASSSRFYINISPIYLKTAADTWPGPIPLILALAAKGGFTPHGDFCERVP